MLRSFELLFFCLICLALRSQQQRQPCPPLLRFHCSHTHSHALTRVRTFLFEKRTTATEITIHTRKPRTLLSSAQHTQVKHARSPRKQANTHSTFATLLFFSLAVSRPSASCLRLSPLAFLSLSLALGARVHGHRIPSSLRVSCFTLVSLSLLPFAYIFPASFPLVPPS